MAFSGHANLKLNTDHISSMNSGSSLSSARARSIHQRFSSPLSSKKLFEHQKTPNSRLLPIHRITVPRTNNTKVSNRKNDRTIPEEIKLVNKSPKLSPMANALKMEEENLSLKQQVHFLQQQLMILKQNISPAVRKKARKEIDKQSDFLGRQFPKICKDIAKEKIWRYVKFINDESMLEEYRDKSSIGYLFLSYYRNINDNNPTNNIEVIWDEARDYVAEAIGAKRNAVQTRIKKCFKGKNKNTLFL